MALYTEPFFVLLTTEQRAWLRDHCRRKKMSTGLAIRTALTYYQMIENRGEKQLERAVTVAILALKAIADEEASAARALTVVDGGQE